MEAWHQSRRGDLGLPATRVLLYRLSHAAFARLMATRAPRSADSRAYGLTGMRFTAASCGSAMLFLGISCSTRSR
jgi:hypothetical protein